MSRTTRSPGTASLCYSKLRYLACCCHVWHTLTHDALRSRLAAAEEALAEQEAVVSRALREKEEALLKKYALQVAEGLFD